MSTPKTGGQAFPKTGNYTDDAPAQYDSQDQDGMTLRDYFAAKAMEGFIAADDFPELCEAHRQNGKTTDDARLAAAADIAKTSFIFADTMIAARDAAPEKLGYHRSTLFKVSDSADSDGYDVLAGSSIWDAIADAVKIAGESGRKVQFVFNKQLVTVKPGDDKDALYRDFAKAIESPAAK